MMSNCYAYCHKQLFQKTCLWLRLSCLYILFTSASLPGFWNKGKAIALNNILFPTVYINWKAFCVLYMAKQFVYIQLIYFYLLNLRYLAQKTGLRRLIPFQMDENLWISFWKITKWSKSQSQKPGPTVTAEFGRTVKFQNCLQGIHGIWASKCIKC